MRIDNILWGTVPSPTRYFQSTPNFISLPIPTEGKNLFRQASKFPIYFDTKTLPTLTLLHTVLTNKALSKYSSLVKGQLLIPKVTSSVPALNQLTVRVVFYTHFHKHVEVDVA